jgi:diguanylate cyclase (GGDEF)-like protein
MALAQQTSDLRVDSERTMALTLGILYFAGAAIGALTLLLPHPAVADDAGLWVNTAMAAIAAATLTAFAPRFPEWSLQVAVAVGTLMVTAAVYLSHDAGSFYSYWYVWVGLYVFLFFGRRWGAAHMLLMGTAYGWVLTQVPHTSPIARWVMVIGTVAIAGVVVGTLVQRVREWAAEADSRAHSLAAISDTAHELARHTSSEGAGLVVCEAALRVASADAAALWEPASSGTGLEVTAATDPAMLGRSVPFVSSPFGAVRAFSSAEPGMVEIKDDPVQRPSSEFDAGSALFHPVVHEGSPVAVLALYWTRSRERASDELSQAISLLAAEAAIAIERAAMLARLERVARTDDLTGLANRRAWDEHLIRELARAERTDAPLALAVLDLDRFKDYNDEFGHQAGDRVLKEVAARWVGLLRETDILARYGGEEFALALPGAGLEEASQTVERLRAATPMGQRVSAGLVCWDGSEDPTAIVARADEALYAAKRGGRDCLVTR